MITRNLALQAGFSNPPTLGAGLIHKLITVDTPHLGTPIAQQFLAPTGATCVRNLLAWGGNFAFNTVTSTSGVITGAVGDLKGAGDGTQLSDMLQGLKKNGGPIPTATIAGIVDDGNLLGLAPPSNATAIRTFCPTDTLAAGLTPTTWNSFFVADSSLYPADPAGGSNDGVVGENSELNGLALVPDLLFTGRVHSGGIVQLGFAPPTMLDTGAVPLKVIDLLNTPVTNTTYYRPFTP
jgi:hypothetical protein